MLSQNPELTFPALVQDARKDRDSFPGGRIGKIFSDSFRDPGQKMTAAARQKAAMASLTALSGTGVKCNAEANLCRAGISAQAGELSAPHSALQLQNEIEKEVRPLAQMRQNCR